jgi:hypothetical protein
MKHLLFGGAPSVGKTGSINRLVDDYLIQQRKFNCTSISNNSFFRVLDGNDKNGKPIKIIVSSASDKEAIVDEFHTYYKSNPNCNFIISPIRDEGDYMRQYFLVKIAITDYIEIPLAKITRRNDRQSAIQWYEKKVYELAANILENQYGI